MKKVMKKRAGFTLVELLIVIIIIGILAGAMLLVAGSGTDKANATKVVSDMRSLKAATLMKYADAGNWTWVSGDVKPILKTYMDRDIANVDVAKYDVVTSNDSIIVKAEVKEQSVFNKIEVGDDTGVYVVTGKTVYTKVK